MLNTAKCIRLSDDLTFHSKIHGIELESLEVDPPLASAFYLHAKLLQELSL